MSSRLRKRRTATRTFRLDEECDQILQSEAEKQGVSVNTLVNQILRRYMNFGRFADRYGVITIPNKTLVEILKATTEERLAEAGKISGMTRPKDGLLMMGKPLNFDSLAWMVGEMYGGPDCARWFKCDHHTGTNEDVFHIRHSLGKKWSMFISSYLTSMFKAILDLDVEPTLLDQAVTIRIKHKVFRE